MPRILCLHTADVHVGTFTALYAELAPGAEVAHVVRADWLAEARRSGLSGALTQDVRAFLLDAALRHDAVLCSCSTLGPIAEAVQGEAPNVVRIDAPLMLTAAAHAGTVLVAFCLESTRTPTLDLLTATYARLGKPPQFETVLCAEAWPLFERGDTAGFANAIAARVKPAAAGIADLACIVLAQASMAVAEPLLPEVGAPVYASPRLAVEATLRATDLVTTSPLGG